MNTLQKLCVSLFLIPGINQAQNLVVNGDFESGNTDFTTEYIEDCTSPNDGEYCVTEPYDWSTIFLGWNPVSTNDTLGATGKMLHVNGNPVAGAKIWCQTISGLSPNQDYKFSTSITTIYSGGNPAELQFSINGTALNEPIVAPNNSDSWNTFFDLWNSGNNESAEICIVNNNTISNGNDFVLDNIRFEPVDFAMPNIFQPNGSGTNDLFTPLSFAGIDVYTITIYDRWGVVVKTINNQEMATPEWDGKTKSGAECPTGVYYWTLTYEFGTDNEKIQKTSNGFVQLIR